MSTVWSISSPKAVSPIHRAWLEDMCYKFSTYYFALDSASIYVQTDTEEQEMLLILKFGDMLRKTKYHDVDIFAEMQRDRERER